MIIKIKFIFLKKSVV